MLFSTAQLFMKCSSAFISHNTISVSNITQTDRDLLKGWMHACKHKLNAFICVNLHTKDRYLCQLMDSVCTCVFLCMRMNLPNVKEKQSECLLPRLGDSLSFLHTDNTHSCVHSEYYVHRLIYNNTKHTNVPPLHAHAHSAIWPKSFLTPKRNQKAFIAPSSHCTDVLYLNFIFPFPTLHLCFVLLLAFPPHVLLSS